MQTAHRKFGPCGNSAPPCRPSCSDLRGKFSRFMTVKKDFGDGYYEKYTCYLWMTAVMLCVPAHFGLDQGKQNCHRVHSKWTVQQPQAHSIGTFSLLNLWLFSVSFHAHTHTHTIRVRVLFLPFCFPQRILHFSQRQNTFVPSWTFGGLAVN